MLGLSSAVFLNAYTFYTYGRQECEYSLELYRQSIAGIFGGLFTGLLLITILIIPADPPTSDQTNKSYARSIMAFSILFIISALLTALETYLFIANQVFNWVHELSSCHREYYDAAYATTILSAVPVYIIGMAVLGRIISLIITGCDNWCCQTNNRGYYRLPTTNRNTQTTPKFINPETNRRQPNLSGKAKTGDPTNNRGSNSSDDVVLSLDGDDFTFDAPELQLTQLITSDPPQLSVYPSRKYQYPSATNLSATSNTVPAAGKDTTH